MATPLRTPVLFLVFNRPDKTALAFPRIAAAQPRQLFIAADGPRPGRPDDVEACRQVRALVQRITWDCQVYTLLRDTNLGCRQAVSGAISWFFKSVEEGIILEDDCLPSPSFFPFCEGLLAHYRDDHRIMMISGDNFQDGQQRGDGDYYFSRLPMIWGWATWRRAWQCNDAPMATLPRFVRANRIAEIFPSRAVQDYWLRNFLRTFQGKIDTWDHSWTYSIFARNGLCILPNTNLVTNVGGGADATHTTDATAEGLNRPAGELQSLRHPQSVQPDAAADQYMHERYLNVTARRTRPPLKRVAKRIRLYFQTRKLIRDVLAAHPS